MTTDEPNYYAPPAEVSAATAPRLLANVYASERRPVILTILLTVFTGGIYPTVWFLRRQRFLDGLRSSTKLGTLLPVIALALNVFRILLLVAGQETAIIRTPLALGAAITLLMLAFRSKRILEQDLRAATWSQAQLSGLATFFFGIQYLQYRINRAAEMEFRELEESPPRPRKKRKRRRAPALSSS
jgi:hypothetical protein